MTDGNAIDRKLALGARPSGMQPQSAGQLTQADSTCGQATISCGTLCRAALFVIRSIGFSH